MSKSAVADWAEDSWMAHLSEMKTEIKLVSTVTWKDNLVTELCGSDGIQIKQR